MLKLFLVIALTINSSLLHAGIGKGLKGKISATLKRKLIRVFALPALKEMVKVEVGLPAIQVLEDFDVGFVFDESKVNASALTMLMMNEYDLRMLALTHGLHHKATARKAENISSMFGRGVVGLDLHFAPDKGAISQSNALLMYYKSKLADYKENTFDEAVPGPESPSSEEVLKVSHDEDGNVVSINIDEDELVESYASLVTHKVRRGKHWQTIRQGWNQSLILKQMEYHGSSMTKAEVKQRFRQRWALAKYYYNRIADTLDHLSLSKEQLNQLFNADLNISWDISSHVVVSKLGQTVPPGLLVLAQVAEFAARVLAFAERDSEAVEFALSLIVDMKNFADDTVIMQVSTSKDPHPTKLSRHNLEEIAELYRQQVN